ncbi:MAG: hypothetical protein RL258_30 [Pseudomonadota bacterium]
MSAFLFRAPATRRLTLVLALVFAVHGAVVFALLEDRAPPVVEVPAMVAFFVSPPSSSVSRPPAPVVATRPPTPIMPRPAVAPSPVVAQPLPSQAVVPVDPSPAQSAPAAALAALPAPSSEAVAPAPTTVATAPAAPLEVSIESVRYIRPPQVVYPPLSRRLGEAGRVVVRVRVSTEGVPVEVTLAEPSAYGRLNEQALQAMRQARFDPYRVNGRPISVTILAPVVFKLEDRE